VPAARAAVLVGFDSVDAAVASLPVLRSLPALQAVELVLRGGLDVVAAHLGETAPVPSAACALLVEVVGDPDTLVEQLGAALELLGNTVVDSAAAADPAGVDRLWRWREAHSEAAASLGLVHKADVTLPHTALAAFATEVPAVVASEAPASTTLVYGHLADGNLHVNVVGPAAGDDAPIDAVLELVLRHGGSVSAEHGIGRAKRAWLVAQRGEAAVAAMRSIKTALDPDGVLNPGVLLP
jgi:FAD/FMN-containing dehydrogenase